MSKDYYLVSCVKLKSQNIEDCLILVSTRKELIQLLQELTEEYHILDIKSLGKLIYFSNFIKNLKNDNKPNDLLFGKSSDDCFGS